MRLFRSLLVLLLTSGGAVPATAVAEQATGSVVVTAQFSSRTSLDVSARLLRFEVENAGETASVAVDFAAGARTALGGEVLLSVEAVRAVDGPGGAADIETLLSFTGEGAGTLDGPVAAHGPTVAGRWSGSGLRSGRLVFALRAGAAGTYEVPLRFVLSAP